MRVKNINGTSGRTCACGSWLNHWRRYAYRSRILRPRCAEWQCPEWATVGAHVQRVNYFDGRWYIVPLCNEHNQQKAGTMEVGSTPLISANINETCGQRKY